MNRSSLRLLGFVGTVILLVACNKSRPPNAVTDRHAVDSIKGFNSINLGSTLKQLSGRFSSVAPITLENEKYSDDYQFRTIAALQPDEREWGGVAITEIEVHFRQGFASEIILRLNPAGDQLAVLYEAFTQKYGPYTRFDNEHQTSWVGHDTEVTFYTLPGAIRTTFRSLSVERAAEAKNTRRDNEDSKRRTKEATELSRKL